MVSRVNVDDIEIAYRVFGEDRGSVPLVMVMGLAAAGHVADQYHA
jgi:hypothetical protein